MATEQELSDFLKNTEKRAFKRTLYHVRNEESALDILQDSMIKLATHYGDKPATELPMLFQRILSNTTLDWFRRQKTRNALFSNMSDFGTDADGEDFDLGEDAPADEVSPGADPEAPTAAPAAVPDMVPFNAVMTMDGHQVLYDAIAKAKHRHGLETTADALLALSRSYLDA